MSREGAWLVEAVHDPEAAVAAIFASLPEVPLDELSDALREAKRRIALLTGLAAVLLFGPLYDRPMRSIEYKMRRCTGFWPSHTSGKARPLTTDSAYSR